MRAGPSSSGRARGFSLLEVLMVLAIVVVLWGAASSFPRRDGGGATLRSAEAELVSLLTLARSNAVRLNRATRLFIECDPAPADGGQRLFILSLDPTDNRWEPVGQLHRLGTNAVVVAASLLHAFPVDGAGEDLASSFHGETSAGWTDGVSLDCGYVHFSPIGTSFGTPQLVLMPARADASGWTLTEPQRARRILVRPAGTVTVRDAAP